MCCLLALGLTLQPSSLLPAAPSSSFQPPVLPTLSPHIIFISSAEIPKANLRPAAGNWPEVPWLWDKYCVEYSMEYNIPTVWDKDCVEEKALTRKTTDI